jgi:hypothetical protein
MTIAAGDSHIQGADLGHFVAICGTKVTKVYSE